MLKFSLKKNLRIAKKPLRNREDQLKSNKSNGKNNTNIAIHTKLLKLKHNKIISISTLNLFVYPVSF